MYSSVYRNTESKIPLVISTYSTEQKNITAKTATVQQDNTKQQQQNYDKDKLFCCSLDLILYDI